MTALRVLHLIGTTGAGGAERLLSELLSRSSRLGIAPEVAVLGDPGWLTERAQGAGIPVHCFSKRGTLDISFLRALTRFIQAASPALVHCHLAAMNLYGCLAAHRAGVPCVAHVHGLRGELDRPRRRWAQRLTWRAATRIIAVSDGVASALRRYGAPPGKIVHIPNGVDLTRFAAANSESDCRRRLGVAPGSPALAVVARLEAEKGVDLALQAFAIMHQQSPRARLLIAGQGSQLLPLQAMAKALGVAEATRFLGFTEDVPSVLQAAQLVLVPSRSEGFSLAAVEAMAAARPVVAWACDGPSEIVVDGVTGRLVPPFDTRGMAAASLALVADPAGAARMGEAGKLRAEARYSLERMETSLHDLYTDVITKARG